MGRRQSRLQRAEGPRLRDGQQWPAGPDQSALALQGRADLRAAKQPDLTAGKGSPKKEKIRTFV
ncbi:hypothetical protein SGRA_2821 [Saprospira grandis str. Lewin]|uniref:Uncharacterized protein n=1 Tax=Saprospira grandis (strain Lewin) TaxID=984262 RepID=H6LA81_SAPGL|nr:hypothetical protein SGRA_2821 [Saprospira grandis str. Lewin]